MSRRMIMSVLSNSRVTNEHKTHSPRWRHRVFPLARQGESHASRFLAKLSPRHFRASMLAGDDDPPLFV